MLTTLAEIKSHDPCRTRWKKLLRHLGKSGADEEPLGLLTVLDGNGIYDALWVLDHVEPGGRLARHISAWCAEQVLPIFEQARPGDLTARRAIDVARDDDATPEDRAKAVRDVQVATRDIKKNNVWNAAWAAAWAPKGDAYRAAIAAARTDADLDWYTAGGTQSAQLRKMLTEGF